MKICQYFRLHMKTICWRFHIEAPFTLSAMRTWDMWKVCLQTFRNNRVRYKLAYFLKILQTSRGNNSRILRIQNAKFSGYWFSMNTSIQGYFQICISVPLKKRTTPAAHLKLYHRNLDTLEKVLNRGSAHRCKL